MLILVFLVDSTAAEMAVNGGATTMSQKLASATSGANAAKNARASAMLLYIFQLPAITRRLIKLSSCPSVLLFLSKRFNARKLAPAEKFQRSSATSGNMRNLTSHAGPVDRGNRVPSPNNGGRAAIRGTAHSFSDSKSSLCKCRHFEYSHRAVPHNCFRFGNFRRVQRNRPRSNIQPHLLARHSSHIYHFRGRIRFELRRDHVIGRQHKFEIPGTRVVEDFFS